MSERFIDDIRRDIERELSRLLRDVENLVVSVSRKAPVRAIKGLVFPDVDIYETEDKIIIVANLPGVPRDKVSVHATENAVEISGEVPEPLKGARVVSRERIVGDFVRVIRLPEKVKPEGAKARIENGLLILELPRAETERRVRINIE